MNTYTQEQDFFYTIYTIKSEIYFTFSKQKPTYSFRYAAREFRYTFFIKVAVSIKKKIGVIIFTFISLRCCTNELHLVSWVRFLLGF